MILYLCPKDLVAVADPVLKTQRRRDAEDAEEKTRAFLQAEFGACHLIFPLRPPRLRISAFSKYTAAVSFRLSDLEESNAAKVRCGGTPKPTRGTRMLPGFHSAPAP